MQLLEKLEIEDKQGSLHHIELYMGDLTAMDARHAVDLLVVSAAPNNYEPVKNTLVAALLKSGISLKDLAQYKAVDLRQQFSCWLSADVNHPDARFRKIFCFEPWQRGEPAEVVSDIFQGLMPFLYSEQISTLAMPLVATGNQKVKPGLMINRLLQAATHWLEMGMPLNTLKIVEIDAVKAKELKEAFELFKNKYLSARKMGIKHWTPFTEPSSERQPAAGSAPVESTALFPGMEPLSPLETHTYDVFISYSRRNAADIEFFARELQAQSPGISIFLDRKELNVGSAWQQELYEALDDCRKVVTFYSPDYLASKVCKEEFNIALFRHRECKDGVLVPIYLQTAKLPTYMQLIQYIDCRENRQHKLKEAAGAVLERLGYGSN